MSAHLQEHELTAAVAGLDLDESARSHLQTCLVCRRQAAELEDLIAARRREMNGDEPDGETQHAEIMARLPVEGAVVPMRPRWRRHVLAAAASAVLALGATMLYVQQRGIAPQMESKRAQQILAAVEATLDSDQIPGFETIGETFFATDEDESDTADTADTVESADSTALDVALAALEDEHVNYEVPGFEALGMLVPSLDELEAMIVENGESTATKRRKRA